MSALVKLSPKMPGDFETNGLDAHAAELIDDPTTLRVAVVWFDTLKVTHDVDGDSDVPTIRIRRFEPLGDVDEVSAAVRDLVQQAVEKRTGRKPIPFDTAEVTETVREELSNHTIDEDA